LTGACGTAGGLVVAGTAALSKRKIDDYELNEYTKHSQGGEGEREREGMHSKREEGRSCVIWDWRGRV
jgi:hypothetical protein